MKKEIVFEVLFLLFSDEEEKEVLFGVKFVDKKVESVKELLEFGRIDVVELEKEGFLIRFVQEVVKYFDLFFLLFLLDKGIKVRIKIVFSLFDEEEDKMED